MDWFLFSVKFSYNDIFQNFILMLFVGLFYNYVILHFMHYTGHGYNIKHKNKCLLKFAMWKWNLT